MPVPALGQPGGRTEDMVFGPDHKITPPRQPGGGAARAGIALTGPARGVPGGVGGVVPGRTYIPVLRQQWDLVLANLT